jgi:DNA-binding NtrC family response regulator
MPARIVVVLDDSGLAAQTATAFNAAGYEAVSFADSMAGIEALTDADRIELLITSVNFAAGQPNGVSLALMARMRRPGLKVLFIGGAELREYTEGVGAFTTSPVTVSRLVEIATPMLIGPATLS